jgi:hypothetical protein
MAEALPKYEVQDLSTSTVTWFAVGVLATLLLTFVAIAIFSRALARTRLTVESATRIVTAERSAPPPVLQTNPMTDLRSLRAREDSTLETYGWIDRKAGVIRIPIERAIELTAERGLRARAPQEEHQP